MVLKNLSVHRAENEEDALNLLFIGDTNRVVSETPKNDASTRGHCIFIIQIEGQKLGEDVKTVSKLHLVDLSGSERPSQTGIDGKTQTEAININQSLLNSRRQRMPSPVHGGGHVMTLDVPMQSTHQQLPVNLVNLDAMVRDT